MSESDSWAGFFYRYNAGQVLMEALLFVVLLLVLSAVVAWFIND